MTVTSWIGQSGDWNDPTQWSNGVPTAALDAVIPALATIATITGDGPAASLSFVPAGTWKLTGHHAVGSFTLPQTQLGLTGTASLDLQAATIGLTGFHGTVLTVNDQAALTGASVEFDDALLAGFGGRIDNPIVLSGRDVVSLHGTIGGPLSGTGTLVVGGFSALVLTGTQEAAATVSGAANSYSGGTYIFAGRLETATAGGLGTGPVVVDGGALVVDSGTLSGVIQAATTQSATIRAAISNLLVFVNHEALNYASGSGTTTIVAAPGFAAPRVGLNDFNRMTVNGGAGSVAVFGGDYGGGFYGGTAGHNVIVAGADMNPLYIPGGEYRDYTTLKPPAPLPATIIGGGDGDLLVATGALNNIIVAGSGNETLTGSGATGNNSFFGGSGADTIATGLGSDFVMAGTGAETIFGGAAGTTEIHLGRGPGLVLGGAGTDRIVAGAGNATVFAGSGYDLLRLVNGQAGGSIVVAGFKSGLDQIQYSGYAFPSVASSPGATVLTFTDATNITLLGVTQLGANTLLRA